MSGDILNCALRELKRNRRRSITVAVGYAIVVAFLILVASVLLYSRVLQDIVIGGAGTYFVTWLPACGDISTLTEEELAKLAKGIIPQKCKEQCENCTGCSKKPIDILNEGFIINTNTTRLLTVELAEKMSQLKSLKNASPCLMFRFRDPKSEQIFSVAGIDPASRAAAKNCCSADDVDTGSFLASNSTGKILVDNGFAINHGLKTGMKMTIAEEEFEILGIVKTGARPVKPDVIMLFAESERVINRRIHNPLEKEANLILIEALDAVNHTQAMNDVKVLMKTDSLLTSGCYHPAAAVIGLSSRLIWIFLLIIMAAAILFTVKIQWTSVIERYRSIATVKAIGWTNRVVILQLLYESLIQSVTGSLIGAIVGIAVLVMVPINDILGVDASMTGAFNPFLCLVIFLFSITSGSLAGLLPAILITRQRPQDVLRRS